MAEEFQNNTRMIQTDTSDSLLYGSKKLQFLNDYYAKRFLPAVILVGVLSVVGFIGNVIACYVYGFRLRMNIQHFLFVTLAAVDLLTCGVVMPADIAHMRNFVMFENEPACRLFNLVSWFPSVASSLVLVLIAVDRYMKICRPLSRQMSLRHVKMAVVAVLIFAIVAACPWAVMVEITVRRITPTVLVYKCVYMQSDFFFIYNIIFFVLCICVVVVLSVLYVLIWRAIKQLNQRGTPRTVEDSATSSASPPQPSSPLSSSSVRSSVSTSRTRKTVAAAFAVTLTFIISYIPFFVARTSVDLSPTLDDILTKSRFLNAVVNPFIYSALNPSFRAECFKLFTCFPFCCKRCRESHHDNQAENDNESERDQNNDNAMEMATISSSP